MQPCQPDLIIKIDWKILYSGYAKYFIIPTYFNKQLGKQKITYSFSTHLKVRQNRNDFFKPTFPPKNEWRNSILLLRDLFSFVFWRKLKTPKRHFEIIWPLSILILKTLTFLEFFPLNDSKNWIGIFGKWDEWPVPVMEFTSALGQFMYFEIFSFSMINHSSFFT